MNLRFLADADLNPAIGRGLRRREPAISFQAAEGVIPDGMPDPEVLRMAADLNRVWFRETSRQCRRILPDSSKITNRPDC